MFNTYLCTEHNSLSLCTGTGAPAVATVRVHPLS